MNYEPNAIHWNKGDVVIHDGDAKEPKMLMRVIGYTRDGLCKTQYIDQTKKRTIWKNRIAVLHDPARFGLNENIKQHDFTSVRIWNFHYPEGTTVDVELDNGEIMPTKTRSKACFISDQPMVFLEGIVGAYLLNRVKPSKNRNAQASL